MALRMTSVTMILASSIQTAAKTSSTGCGVAAGVIGLISASTGLVNQTNARKM